MADEDRARSTFAKAKLCQEQGRYDGAIKELKELKGNNFTDMHLQCFDLLTELCLRDASNAKVAEIIAAFKWAKNKLRNTQHLEETTQKMLAIIFKHVRVMCSKAQEEAASINCIPTEDALIISALSGEPVERNSKDCYIAPCEEIIARLAQQLFHHDTIGTTRRIISQFNAAAIQFQSLCAEYNLLTSFEKASESITRTLQRNLLEPVSNVFSYIPNTTIAKRRSEMEMDRVDFFRSPIAGRETIKMLCVFLNFLSSIGRWRQAWYILLCLKHLSEQLFETSASREIIEMAYEEMAKTFWICHNYNFHAFCLVKATMVAGEERDRLLPHALMASLCASDGDASRQPFSHNSSQFVHSDIVDLFDEPLITRTTLLTRLQLQESIMKALPHNILSFINEAESFLTAKETTLENFDTLLDHLVEIVHTYPELQQYKTILESIITRRHLEYLATQHNTISIASFHHTQDNTASSEEEWYVTHLEPILLSDEAIPVEINSKTKTLTLRHSTRANVLNVFTSLAAQLDKMWSSKTLASPPWRSTNLNMKSAAKSKDGNAASSYNTVKPTLAGMDDNNNNNDKSSDNKIKASTSIKNIYNDGDNNNNNTVNNTNNLYIPPEKYIPTDSKISISDLTSAMMHTTRLHELQMWCIDSMASRQQEREKQIEVEKNEKLQERIKAETEKRESAQQAQMAKLMAEYRERLREERCKQMLNRLRVKYPNLKLDNALARKNNAAFEDELTHLLATFKRKSADNERKDVLRANLFERALRNKEIPKRREFDLRNAEERRAEIADARANFLEQHRREFERRQEDKKVLRPFLQEAEAFEEKMRFNFTGKMSKREEQQNLIEQEIRRKQDEAQEKAESAQRA